MAKRQQKAPPQRRLVYEGPVGRCPCCNKPTEVKLGGTLGDPKTTGWTVRMDVLEVLYRQVADRVQKRDEKLYVTDPSEYDATRRSKLFFVDGGDGIAGPFGQLGLKVFLETHFSDNYTEDTCIYIVSTTSRALATIRNSPFAKAPEEVSSLDGSTDLF